MKADKQEIIINNLKDIPDSFVEEIISFLKELKSKSQKVVSPLKNQNAIESRRQKIREALIKSPNWSSEQENTWNQVSEMRKNWRSYDFN